MAMPSTIGDLLPSEPVDGDGGSMVPTGPRIGDLLASAPAPIQVSGGTIRAGDVVAADDMPKKAETLSDLRAMFPDLQSETSGYKIVVERTHPKMRNGMKAAGVLGGFSGFCDGKDILSTEGFEAQFGWGTYVVWVEGPSRSSVDPVTGHPRIVRKAEIKHDVPERPMQPNPHMTPPFYMPHPAASQVELERVRGENRVMDRLAEKALNNMDPQRQAPQENSGVSSIAAEAVRANSAQSQLMIDNLNRQNEALRSQLSDLMERLSHPQSSTTDDIVRTMLARGNSEIESIRSGYERQIDQIRQSYDDRIERMRQDFDRTVERMRQDSQAREDNIRSQMQQSMYSDKTLFEDRFKHEREHLMSQMETIRRDHERSLESAKNEYARNLESLKDSRDRDLEVIQGNQRLIIEAKETEISRLTAENNRLQDKVASLEAKVNMPFHDKVQELRLHSQLLGLGGVGDVEEKPEKPDLAEKALEFAQTPVGQMLAAAALQKFGGINPPANAPQQAPRQIGAAPQQQPPQQRRQKRPAQPAQQPGTTSREAVVKQGEGSAKAEEKPTQHPVEFLGGEQPLPSEQLRQLLPLMEKAFFEAKSNGASPDVIAKDTHAFAEAQLPGSSLTKKLVGWVDAFNFCKILDMVSQGQHGWMSSEAVAWVKDVFSAFVRMNEDVSDAGSDATKEGS